MIKTISNHLLCHKNNFDYLLMNTPLITFIVPAYNAAQYLPACLDSIFALDMQGYGREVIVIDDGSADDTAAVLEGYIRKTGHAVTVKSQENMGPGGARNIGMDAATGKYLCFVDGDDVLASRTFPMEKLVPGTFDIVGFNARRTTSDGRVSSYQRYKYKYDKVYEPASAFMRGRNIMPCVWAYFFRRDYINGNALRFVPHIYHEDDEFIPRAFAAAQTFVALDVDFYNYKETKGSITTTQDVKMQEWKLRDAVGVLRKFHEQSLVDEAFRTAVQCKMDYLAVDILRLLMRMKRSRNFQNEIISSMKSIGYFPLRWRWNVKYIGFNILTRYIFRR